MSIFNKTHSLTKLYCPVYIMLAVLFLSPNAAVAKVSSQSDTGFAVFHIADVAAEPEEIWRKLIVPNRWWSSDHSWSGNAENFYLEAKIDGCFCELLKTEKNGEINDAGAVEHMRIIHIDRARSLRMLGALGPLQSEAVNGTFTIAIKANGDGTSKLSFLYVVGGYMRFEVAKIAPSIDAVMGEQFGNLVKLIGPVLESADTVSTDSDKSELLVVDKGIVELSSDADEIGTEDNKSEDGEIRRER